MLRRDGELSDKRSEAKRYDKRRLIRCEQREYTVDWSKVTPFFSAAD